MRAVASPKEVTPRSQLFFCLSAYINAICLVRYGDSSITPAYLMPVGVWVIFSISFRMEEIFGFVVIVNQS